MLHANLLGEKKRKNKLSANACGQNVYICMIEEKGAGTYVEVKREAG